MAAPNETLFFWYFIYILSLQKYYSVCATTTICCVVSVVPLPLMNAALKRHLCPVLPHILQTSQTFFNNIMCVSTALVELSKTKKKKSGKKKWAAYLPSGKISRFCDVNKGAETFRYRLLWVTELWFPTSPHFLTSSHPSSLFLTSSQSPASPSSSTRGIKSRALICLLPFWPYRRSKTDRASSGDLRQPPPPPHHPPPPPHRPPPKGKKKTFIHPSNV